MLIYIPTYTNGLGFYTIYLNFHMKCVCDEKESEWVCKCVQAYIYMRECWKFIGPTKKPFPYLVKFQEVCCLAINFSVPSHIHMHECVYMHILYVYYVYVFILFVSQDLTYVKKILSAINYSYCVIGYTFLNWILNRKSFENHFLSLLIYTIIDDQSWLGHDCQ